MKTITLLAALALGAALTPAVACDWNKETNNTPVVVADCGNSGCAIQQPSDEPIIRQEPADCSGGQCTTPAPIAPKVTCNGDNCATDDGTTSSEPVTLACADQGC